MKRSAVVVNVGEHEDTVYSQRAQHCYQEIDVLSSVVHHCPSLLPLVLRPDFVLADDESSYENFLRTWG